jgi:hypothetical protein
MLEERISQNRSAIISGWEACVLESYPEETAKFLRAQQDQFANPVGAALREGLAAILDGLLAQHTEDELAPALDRIIRIRAVQELAPSQALAFVLDLRKVIVEQVTNPPLSADELQELAQRIDRLALTAFDVYSRCREQISSIRIKEIRNRSLNRIERLNEWLEKRDRGDDQSQDQEPLKVT